MVVAERQNKEPGKGRQKNRRLYKPIFQSWEMYFFVYFPVVRSVAVFLILSKTPKHNP
jgi:hypothetical protein